MVNIRGKKGSSKIGDLLNTNYKISVSILASEKKVVGAMTFQCKKGFSFLFDEIKKIFFKSISKSEGRKITITLFNLKDNKSKTFNFFGRVDVEPRVLIERLKRKILNIKGCINFNKRANYRIIVHNCHSHCTDSRSLSFTSVLTLENVVGKLKERAERIVDETKTDEIIFSYQNIKSASHRIIVQVSGSAKDYKKYVSKSFSIRLPNYSSSEVIKLVRREIR